MNGGWFSYDLEIKPGARNTLLCTYRGLETGRRDRQHNDHAGQVDLVFSARAGYTSIHVQFTGTARS